MEILKLSLSCYGHYVHQETTSLEMCVLQYFLATDINCFTHYIPSYIEWVQNDSTDLAMAGILTSLDKENDYIVITHNKKKSNKKVEQVPIELKIKRQAFLVLLDDWQEKVCKHKPKEVAIIYNNNEFTIETTN